VILKAIPKMTTERGARYMKMTEEERKERPCAACGKPVGTATIVAGGPYPDAPICLNCHNRYDVEEVFEMIRKRRAGGVT
jgi:hypothetical protein